MPPSFGQYWQLTKPRVVALIVFTAIIGMLLATPDARIPKGFQSVAWLMGLSGSGDMAQSQLSSPALAGVWREILFGSIGIWLAAASAAAINHLLDQRIDKVMARTADRPLATGMLRPVQVLGFAMVLGVASMAILLLLVNAITAWLTFASLIGYAFIYTGFLKRATPQNIVIGGIAGAAPPLPGWVAVTGHISAEPLLLVLIIFAWTPPHFWALAIHRKDEYAKTDIPMLPVTHGEHCTKV